MHSRGTRNMEQYLPLSGPCVQVLVGSLLSAGFVAWLTQVLIQRRERRGRRDDLRRDLYLDIVDLVLDNELVIAESGMEGKLPPPKIQSKRIRAAHRLKLIGSKRVREAYDEYDRLVFQETAQPLQFRSKDPHEVVRAREALIAAMAADVQETR